MAAGQRRLTAGRWSDTESGGGGGRPHHKMAFQKGKMMLTSKQIQAAIAREIENHLRHSGIWIAQAANGEEFGFCMNDTGHIGVYITNNETGEEDEFCFRLEITTD